jgi:hypothetical protein
MKRATSPCADPATWEDIKRTRAARKAQEPSLGTVLRTDEHGEWRTVPGIDGVEVSSEGWLRKDDGHASWTHAHQPNTDKDNYRRFSHRGLRTSVHAVVCTAFHGEKPTPEHTADHINRDRADNRTCNLRWATKEQQRANRNPLSSNCKGHPVYLIKEGEEPLWFSSGRKADEWLGYRTAVDQSLRRGCKAGGYDVVLAPPLETQDDLPGEAWCDWPPFMQVSTAGRARCKLPQGGWGYKYTPKPNYQKKYAEMCGHHFHNIVARAFLGPPPTPGHTADHINRDTRDNRLVNLCWLDKKGQKRNQVLPPIGPGNRDAKKKAVEVLLHGTTTWFRENSQHDAMRTVNETHFPPVSQGSISSVCLEKTLSLRCGCRFRFCS